jgi:hypothetical protein
MIENSETKKNVVIALLPEIEKYDSVAREQWESWLKEKK